MKRAKKGFTLIEVICVLVIIAIVAVIAVPNISRYIDNSKINNCKSTMSGFVNDFEYIIVSKRYYDIDDLNGELVKYVESKADSVDEEHQSSDNDDGTFKSLSEKLKSASGVCPNGGSYTIEWEIEPYTDNTAKVHIHSCKCNCMDGDNTVEYVKEKALSFTAALITSSEYIKSGLSQDQIYENEIIKIIDYINGNLTNPAKIDELIAKYKNEHPDSNYIIKGVTVREQKGSDSKNPWVEWICVDINKNYDAFLDGDDKSAHDFITYYPDSKSGSSSEIVSDLQDGKLTGKMVVTPMSDNDASDMNKWPPVEGTAGSYYYLEGMNYSNNTSYQVADISKADKIKWIQREGTWYVQKNDRITGIDSVGQNNNQLNSEAKLDTSSPIKTYSKEASSDLAFKEIFTACVRYEDGTEKFMDHLQSSDLSGDNPYDYFIKNGYILVSSTQAVENINWAGIVNEKQDENGNIVANEQRENLKNLLAQEDELVTELLQKIAAGKFDKTEFDSNGKERKYNELTIAYQEYFKTFDANGNYTYTPYTSFGTVRIYQKTDSNGNVIPGAEIYVENGGTESAIGSISVRDIPGSYNIKYKQSEGSEVFSTDDLIITRKVEYSIKDIDGNVKASFITDATLEPATSANDPNGYFIGGDTNFTTDKTSQSVAALNNGGVSFNNSGSLEVKDYFIYLTGTNDSLRYQPLATISTREMKQGSLKWDYDKSADDTAFSLDKISAWVEYPVKITYNEYGGYGKVGIDSDGTVKVHFSRKTPDNPDGWYMTYNDKPYSQENEAYALGIINDYTFDAQVKLYKAGEGHINNITIYDVKTDLRTVTESHVVKFDGVRTYTLYLDVYAQYSTSIIDKSNSNTYSDIHFSRQLDRHNDSKRRFYVNDKYNLNTGIYEENNFLDNRFTVNFHDDMYVYYSDKYYTNHGKTCYTKFRFSIINIPEFIYFHDTSDYLSSLIPSIWTGKREENMHVIAYIGNDINITIPSKVTGYWSLSKPRGERGKDYEIIVYNGYYYYYVNDGKEYDIVNVGYNYGEEVWTSVLNGGEFYAHTTASALKFPNDYPKENFERINMKITEGVKAIGTYAFSGFTMESLSLPSSIEYIDFAAFYKTTLKGNSSKYTFTVPESVNNIDSYAFYKFKVNGTLQIDGVTSDKKIAKNVFSDSEFKKLAFGSRVENIDADAFIDNKSAASLDLGSVKTIGANAFNGWINAQGDLKIPSSITSIGESAFDSYASAETDKKQFGSLTIEGGSYNNGNSLGGLIFTNGHFKNLSIGGNVKHISGSAFRNDELNGKKPYSNFVGSLTIEDTVEKIDDNAFRGCSGFSGSLTLSRNPSFNKISTQTFEECTGFTGDLTIPSNVTEIASRAFACCSGFDGKLTLESGVKSIGTETFIDCKHFTGGLTIPDSVTNGISKNAFSNFASEVDYDKAGTLNILAGSYENGKKLGSFIFTGSQFRGVTIGGIVEEVAGSAFHHDKTVSDYSQITGGLSIGESVKTISVSAFESLGINSLSGLRNVVSIGDGAFRNCTLLESDVMFEDNRALTTIGNEAFLNDSQIISLRIPNTVVSIGLSAFDNTGSGEGSLEIYGASRTDSSGKKILGDHVHTIFNNAKYRNVTIGGSVDVIDRYFMKTEKENGYDYSNVKGNLTIKGNVSEIVSEAFNGTGFDGILSFEGNSLTTIGYSAFENLTKMHGDLTIPKNVHKIDRRAFKKFAMDANNEDLGVLRIKGYSETNGDEKIIGYRLFSYARFNTVEIGGENSEVNTIGNFAFYNSNTEYNGMIEDKQSGFEDLSQYENENDRKVYRSKALGYGYDDEEFELNKDTSNYLNFTKNVKILDGVETIGIRAFGDNYSIIAVDLSGASSLTTIRDDAFNRCTNASGDLIIPNTVSNIGRCAFKQFGQNTDEPGTLTILGYSDSSSDGNIRYIGIPLGDITNDPKPIFPSAKFRNVVIGGTEDEATVNAIGDKFMNNLKPSDPTYNYSGITGSLTIGESITSIGREAFVLCTGFDGQLTLNENLKSIGQDAFNACNGFRGDLLIPSTVESIGKDAFKHFGQGDLSSDYNLSSLTVLGFSSVNSDNKRTIDADIFNHAHFKNITIGGNVDRIADSFMDNTRTETLSDGRVVTMFNGVRGDLTITDNVSEIGEKAFYRCANLKGKLSLNNNLTSIGVQAFAETKFFEEAEGEKNLTIPETVTYIGERAFERFSEGISDPASLTIYGYSTNDEQCLVGSQLFDYACFRDVTIGGNVKALSGWAFSDSGNKFKGFTGTLTIIPYTVGFDNGEYIPLEEKFGESGIYYGGGMSIGTDNSNRFGTFRGCYFDKVVFPEELYNMYMKNQYDLFGQYNGAPKNQSFVYEIYR